MTGGRKTRLYRVIIDKWPTPDGRPYDVQPPAAYAAAINAWHGSKTARPPAWLAGIPWQLHIGGDALPGVWMATPDGVPFTVPQHRRAHYMTPAAARRALNAVEAWGAAGRIETSDPITWTGTK